jgi:hypothetical protein
MAKCSGSLVILSLTWMLSQAAFAQQSPLFSSACSGELSRALATPASLEAALPGIIPEPTPRATYICGPCSQAQCVGMLSDDECDLGSNYARCVVSFAWTCEPPSRTYCACMPYPY